ncbi:MerR family transcriptional regulator [Zwartia sp.]|uniref:MerR family transcriptional regulator n=1 Tax=Zwartia sp. TaxID=2978004 RepID=UPI003BAE64E8
MSVESKNHNYRIGTISKLAGIPVPTLRVWESRYAAFTPIKTEGQHRLYGEEDLLRATLIKQLCDEGHGISTIANLNVQALSQLHHKHRNGKAIEVSPARAQQVTMAVIGLGLARRIEAKKFALDLLASSIEVTDIFSDLEAAQAGTFEKPAEILLIKVNTLHEIVMHEIEVVKATNKATQVIVIYNYGREQVAHAMRAAGMLVRREPISDYELGELIRSILTVEANHTLREVTPSAMIPARKYSDETLARVAGISTNVLCECPKHVAEIIAQLASFEQYSQECLNKSTEDAHLHAYLTSVSGSARALFEHALEKVAQHEGIEL